LGTTRVSHKNVAVSKIFAGCAIYSHIKLAAETTSPSGISILFDEFAIIKLAVAGSNTVYLSG
jgi:hypothetical protein